MMEYITKDGIKKILELIHTNSGGSGGITVPINVWELVSSNEPGIVKQSEGVWYVDRLTLNSSSFTFVIEVPAATKAIFSFNGSKSASSSYPSVSVYLNNTSNGTPSTGGVNNKISGSNTLYLDAGLNTYNVLISGGSTLSVNNLTLSLTPVT